MVNHSFSTAQILSVWKKSLIVPFPKVSNPKSPPDLGPINLLVTCSKILEKILGKHLRRIADEWLLPNIQSDFRTNFSTSTTLLRVTNYVRRAVVQ